MNEQQLPPLPKPAIANGPGSMFRFNYYTADQMQAYARAALAANVPADPCLVLWKAMNQAGKVGNRTDDKLIVKFLRDAGYCIATIAPEATRSQRLAEAGYTRRKSWKSLPKDGDDEATPACTCPSGDGSLRWPCPEHPAPAPEATPAWDAATHKELVSLLCSVADNLDDGGVTPEWENRTCLRAVKILERLGEVQPAQAQQSSEADEELCRQAMQRWRDSKPEAQQHPDTQDAERYRWLRDEHIGDDPESINLRSGKTRGLDAAIDWQRIGASGDGKPEAQQHPDTQDAERYRWLRNESWAGYNISGGKPHVFTMDGAGNRRMMLAEEAMDEAVDKARGIGASGEASNG